MRLVIDLTLPNEARLISQTRRVISGYLEEMGVTRDVADDVVLAMDEACTNVMRHAFPDPENTECFRLTADVGPDEVIVVVEDTGIGLAPDSLDPRVVDVTATSGRGLQMISKLMTDVAVETGHPRQGTRLEMRRTLP